MFKIETSLYGHFKTLIDKRLRTIEEYLSNRLGNGHRYESSNEDKEVDDDKYNHVYYKN